MYLQYSQCLRNNITGATPVPANGTVASPAPPNGSGGFGNYHVC